MTEKLNCMEHLPDARSLRIEGERKILYFDVDTNRSGLYLRISEVSILPFLVLALALSYALELHSYWFHPFMLPSTSAFLCLYSQ